MKALLAQIFASSSAPRGADSAGSAPQPTQYSISATGGLRANKGKARLSIVPASLLNAVAKVLWQSAKENGGKYPMHNWRKGLPWSETLDSLLRHCFAMTEGELNDPESGLPHVYHIATNAAFLVEYFEKHPELNDLYKPEGSKGK